jgi:hypothetical protein
LELWIVGPREELYKQGHEVHIDEVLEWRVFLERQESANTNHSENDIKFVLLVVDHFN